MPKPMIIRVTIDEFSGDDILQITINKPIVEGTEGVHAFSLTRTALGKFTPKRPEARARILSLILPIANAHEPTTEAEVIEGLNRVLGVSL